MAYVLKDHYVLYVHSLVVISVLVICESGIFFYNLAYLDQIINKAKQNIFDKLADWY